MTYHFAIDRTITFSRPNLPGISATLPLSGMVNSPQQLMVSAFHTLAHDWAIMGNLGWQDWSRYNDNEVTIFDRTTPQQGLYQDSYHLALGLQHALTPQWTLNGGVAYDTSAYRDQDHTSLTAPSGSALRLGTGVTYALTPQETLGAGFEYIHMESASVDERDLSGRYPTPALYFFALNYGRRF